MKDLLRTTLAPPTLIRLAFPLFVLCTFFACGDDLPRNDDPARGAGAATDGASERDPDQGADAGGSTDANAGRDGGASNPDAGDRRDVSDAADGGRDDGDVDDAGGERDASDGGTDSGSPTDAGASDADTPDSGGSRADAGRDADSGDLDAGTPDTDASDAGAGPTDGGAGPTDTDVGSPDADAGACTSCTDDDGCCGQGCDITNDNDCDLDCRDASTWPSSWSDYEEDVIDLTNAERAAGATCGSTQFTPEPPLSYDPDLREAARCHSLDMANQDFFSHTGSDGDSVYDRIDQTDYDPESTGENIAADYTTPQDVVTAWMKSTGHCENIMSDEEDVGVGYLYIGSSTYGEYWTQDFGTER